MTKEINELKTAGFDNFKCTADKCSFTCCTGWDISVDNDTLNKIKSKEDTKYILKDIKTEIIDDEKYYYIDKETHNVCSFLSDNKLCNIVINHGDECLSHTCRTFPRIKNSFDNLNEYSLSLACKEVVNIISNLNSKMNLIGESSINIDDFLELKLRDDVLKIITNNKYKLDQKLIAVFQMLATIEANEEITEDELLEMLSKYQDVKYLDEVIDEIDNLDFDLKDSLKELNNLFLDITQNYKSVSVLEELLLDICHFGENSSVKKLSKDWDEFKVLYQKNNDFLENCIVSKVISSLVSDDIVDFVLSYQMILLEYILTRYALYLKYLTSNEIEIEDIKNYIMAFSRIIGNNSEATEEFLEEGFGYPILETSYVSFITLF